MNSRVLTSDAESCFFFKHASTNHVGVSFWQTRKRSHLSLYSRSWSHWCELRFVVSLWIKGLKCNVPRECWWLDDTANDLPRVSAKKMSQVVNTLLQALSSICQVLLNFFCRSWLNMLVLRRTAGEMKVDTCDLSIMFNWKEKVAVRLKKRNQWEDFNSVGVKSTAKRQTQWCLLEVSLYLYSRYTSLNSCFSLFHSLNGCNYRL